MSDYYYPQIAKLREEIEYLKSLIDIYPTITLDDCRDCRLKLPHGTSARSFKILYNE